MDCLMMEKAALIMAWLATHAAAVAKTNTNCRPEQACQDLCMRNMIQTIRPCDQIQPSIGDKSCYKLLFLST